MPAFGRLLSHREIGAFLDFIKGTWPETQTKAGIAVVGGQAKSLPLAGSFALAAAPLGGHLPAALRAAAAGIDALLHVTETLAIIGALLANLGALAADRLVMLGPEQHEMR